MSETKVDEEERWWEQEELTKLILASKELTEVSVELLTAGLTVLDLHDNRIAHLPKEIGRLEHLAKLNLNYNNLTGLPTELFGLRTLVHLTVANNDLDHIAGEGLAWLDLLETLDLSHNNLRSLPPDVGHLCRLTTLTISHNQLVRLPVEIGFLRSLRTLDASCNKLEGFEGCVRGQETEALKDLTNLEQLYLHHNRFEFFPDLGGCLHLKEVFLGYNAIKEVLDLESKAPRHVKVLDLRDNKLGNLPDAVIRLGALERLDLTNNDMTNLPSGLGLLPHLVSLKVEGNPIKTIRRDILQRGTVGLLKYLRSRIDQEEAKRLLDQSDMSATDPGSCDLRSLAIVSQDLPPVVPDRWAMKSSRAMNLSKKSLHSVPDEAVANAVEAGCVDSIDLSGNCLTEFPGNLEPLMPRIFDLNLSSNRLSGMGGQLAPPALALAKNLQYLNLSQNALDGLPEEVSLLRNLREVCLSLNRFESIPACLFGQPKLEILVMSGNKISEIPVEGCLDRLDRLAVLDLSNNNISHVPPVLGRMTQLRSVQLEGNPFRVPRAQVLSQGTQAVLSYLRDRIPGGVMGGGPS